MSFFRGISVDCVFGDEECDSSSIDKSFKTLDAALDSIKSGNKIYIYPGNYPGSNLSSSNGTFSYELEGTGTDVEIGFLNHEGFIDGIFKHMKIRDIELNCSNSYNDFRNILFMGGHKMKCKGFLGLVENPVNEIEFCDCTFGINFQIIVESGIYRFTFKNCKFRSKIIPIIYTKNGDITISTTLCNFNVPLVNNKNAIVYIYHTSCNFTTDIWTDKECSVFSKDGEVAFSALKSYNIEQEKHIKTQQDDINSFSVALEVDTNQYSHIELKSNTEFLKIHGLSSLIVELPNSKNVNNGHKIEIINDVPFIVINDVEYYSRLINIRFITQSGWIFY